MATGFPGMTTIRVVLHVEVAEETVEEIRNSLYTTEDALILLHDAAPHVELVEIDFEGRAIA